jgi:CO/xanthine dehydrogenase Mo-binding subunit
VAGVEDTAHLYAFGAVETKVNVVHADRNTPGFMRSPPVVPYIYALESAMDELAVKLEIDPIELRRINDTMTDPIEGKPYSSRSLMKCYDQAADAFGWKRRDPRPGSMGEGDWLVGWGCATAFYPTHVGAATARVRLSPNGEVRAQTAAHEIGNGVYTVLGQLAAEQLGVPLSSVTVEVGDSSLPPAPVAGGSNTTASTSSAVIKACGAIRAKLLRAAVTANDGPLAGRSLEQLALRDGTQNQNELTPFEVGGPELNPWAAPFGLNLSHGKHRTATRRLHPAHLGSRCQESHVLGDGRNDHCIDGIRPRTLVCGGISVPRNASSWAGLALVARYSSGDRVDRRRHHCNGRACPQDAPR